MKNLVLSIFTIAYSITIFSQSNCQSPNASALLDANNVGLSIGPSGHTGFNFSSTGPGYEVPIGSNTYSIFAMSSWIGGITPSQELRFAGQLYRQSGDSYWAGPLPSDGSLGIDASVCDDFDQIWEVTREEVDLHREYFSRLDYDAANGTSTASDPPFESGYTIPNNLWNWPGNNFDPLYEFYLAPFIDANGDNIYDPEDGDYPAFHYPDLGAPDLDFHLFGDKAFWWVFNDYGNVHQELPADPMGVEFQCTAYAYSNIPELENTVFFRRKVTNRSITTFSNTYLGQYVDGDLGCYQDDYIGCNVEQGLGMTFNGDALDEDCSGLNGYGNMPPAVGTDILRGPLADENDGIDNNLNGEIDEIGEYWTMSKFTYFQNSSSPISGNPDTGLDAYNLMRGFWNNGQQLTFGGDGTGISGIPTSFAFPGNSDSNNVGTGGQNPGFEWTESSAGNTPGDRRYVQSAGPFTFEPGESVYSHSALIWAQSQDQDDPFSIDAIEQSDILVQEVFDAEFEGLVLGIEGALPKKNCDIQIRNYPEGEIAIVWDSIENSGLDLFNIQGEKVLSTVIQGNDILNLSNLSSGVYILKLENEKLYCTQKVIIQ